MLYGPNKHRQMARSILPSRAPKNARERLEAIRRSHRRAVRQTLSADRRVRNVPHDELFDLGDHTRAPQSAIAEVVRDRRLADTLNHFERWAVAITRDLPPADRLPRVLALLPPGLIGAHAESHLRSLRAITPPADHDRRLVARVRRESIGE